MPADMPAADSAKITDQFSVVETVIEPRAATAGEEDHANPWAFAGEVAEPPKDVDG